MARHLYLHNGTVYEGEIALFRHAHVAASAAQAYADLPGLRPGFVYALTDGSQTSLTDDEVAVWRFRHDHPAGTIRIVPVASNGAL